MTQDALITLTILAFGTLCAAFIILYVVAWLSDRKITADSIALHGSDDELIFLFDDERLVNATHAAHSVLAAAADVGSDWSKFLSVLLHRFPTLQTEISSLAERGNVELESRDGAAILRAEWRDGHARISLFDVDVAHARVEMDHHSLAALEQELETLRATSEHVPFLVWRALKDGTISWANSAYTALADAQDVTSDTPRWPPKPLFETVKLFSTTAGDFKRLPLLDSGETERFYEVFPMTIGDEILYTAVPADRTVRAETALREFMQTLTKTFAHLTIGLAIFDRNRKLVLFNPALTDLTSLPIDFLAMRPELTAFLDRLRNQNMMPEPKNYKSWRQEVSELEAAAKDGTYEEIWSLAGGVTYKVSGRPHADGAIAFLFEDISAEMSLTRRFRAEIETSHAVFDTLDEAIAVFASDGSLLMSNSAYSSLWGIEEQDSIQTPDVNEASRTWHSKCAPNSIWMDAREFVGGLGDRKEWSSSARLWDGRRLTCRFVPLPRGQTLAGFLPENAASTSLPRPQSPSAALLAEV